MSESLTLVVSPAVIGAFLGLAMYNLAMAIFQNFLLALGLLVLITLLFPILYIDRSPRCVYCFGKISAGAQFCPHCGRLQPEDD